MKPLLILPQKHRSDDADLWRAAIRRNWETVRIGQAVDPTLFEGRPTVRYYGNGLHALQLGDRLPISFGKIDPHLLSTLPASLYRISQVVWDESGLPPEELNFDDRIGATSIPVMVRQIRAAAQSGLPDGMVMDFGRLASGEWALIEFNEAWASGLYYCDPDRAFDVIVASQSSSLDIS